MKVRSFCQQSAPEHPGISKRIIGGKRGSQLEVKSKAARDFKKSRLEEKETTEKNVYKKESDIKKMRTTGKNEQHSREHDPLVFRKPLFLEKRIGQKGSIVKQSVEPSKEEAKKIEKSQPIKFLDFISKKDHQQEETEHVRKVNSQRNSTVRPSTNSSLRVIKVQTLSSNISLLKRSLLNSLAKKISEGDQTALKAEVKRPSVRNASAMSNMARIGTNQSEERQLSNTKRAKNSNFRTIFPIKSFAKNLNKFSRYGVSFCPVTELPIAEDTGSVHNSKDKKGIRLMHRFSAKFIPPKFRKQEANNQLPENLIDSRQIKPAISKANHVDPNFEMTEDVCHLLPVPRGMSHKIDSLPDRNNIYKDIGRHSPENPTIYTRNHRTSNRSSRCMLGLNTQPSERNTDKLGKIDLLEGRLYETSNNFSSFRRTAVGRSASRIIINSASSNHLKTPIGEFMAKMGTRLRQNHK